MRYRRLRNISLLGLLLWILVACQRDEAGLHTGSGKGRFVLGGVEMLVETESIVTRATVVTPSVDNLILTLANTDTGESQTLDAGVSEAILDVGNYKLTATFGTDAWGTEPYFYGESTFVIEQGQTSTVSLQVSLASAIIHPHLSDELLAQYISFKLLVSEGTSSREIMNDTDFFVPSGKNYTLTLSGVNKLGASVSTAWNLNDLSAKTRYTVNCNPDLPSFTLPAQADGDVWSKFIYITPMTVDDMISKQEMAEKVLTNIVYEASADGVNWIAAVQEDGRWKIKGLEPSTEYTIRSRFGGVLSTNVQTVTTESGQQLENGDMETWDEVKVADAYAGTAIYCYYLGSQSNHKWNTYNEVTTKGATNSSSDRGLWWRWCSGTISTSDAVSGTAAEISTLAFYTDKLSNVASSYLWDRDGVYKNHVYYKNGQTGKSYLAALFTGEDEYGILHSARARSFSFDYKYTACKNGDQCIVYAKIYDVNKNLLAETEIFNSSGQDLYVRQTLPFTYYSDDIRAHYIKVMFQSGKDSDIGNMMQSKASTYTASPYPNDRIVGSVLKIDNVTLNYE